MGLVLNLCGGKVCFLKKKRKMILFRFYVSFPLRFRGRSLGLHRPTWRQSLATRRVSTWLAACASNGHVGASWSAGSPSRLTAHCGNKRDQLVQLVQSHRLGGALCRFGFLLLLLYKKQAVRSHRCKKQAVQSHRLHHAVGAIAPGASCSWCNRTGCIVQLVQSHRLGGALCRFGFLLLLLYKKQAVRSHRCKKQAVQSHRLHHAVGAIAPGASCSWCDRTGCIMQLVRCAGSVVHFAGLLVQCAGPWVQ